MNIKNKWLKPVKICQKVLLSRWKNTWMVSVSFYCWLLRSLLTAVLWVVYLFVLLHHLVVRAIPHTTMQFTGLHTRMLRNVRLEIAQNTSSTDTYIWFRNHLKEIKCSEKRMQVRAMRFITLENTQREWIIQQRNRIKQQVYYIFNIKHLKEEKCEELGRDGPINHF